MENLSADKILVVDLGSSEITEDELSDELVEEKIGGAAIAKHLYEEHADGDLGVADVDGEQHQSSPRSTTASGVMSRPMSSTGAEFVSLPTDNSFLCYRGLPKLCCSILRWFAHDTIDNMQPPCEASG